MERDKENEDVYRECDELYEENEKLLDALSKAEGVR